MVDVVQLVRASDCGSECRGFESHLPPRINPARFISCRVSCFITAPFFQEGNSGSSPFPSSLHRTLRLGVNLMKGAHHQRIDHNRTADVKIPAQETYQKISALKSTLIGRRQKGIPLQPRLMANIIDKLVGSLVRQPLLQYPSRTEHHMPLAKQSSCAPQQPPQPHISIIIIPYFHTLFIIKDSLMTLMTNDLNDHPQEDSVPSENG